MSIDKLISKMTVGDYVDLFDDIDQLKQAARVLFNQDIKLITEQKERIKDLEVRENDLTERLQIANCLISKIHKQVSEPLIDAPLYTVNPSFQQVKCLSGFINEATNKELIDKMNLHGWYEELGEKG